MSIYRGTPRFEEAVLDMAKSPKSLQARLVDAFHHLSSCDLPGSLPDDLMTDFKELWARATVVDPEAVDIAGDFKGEGSLTATLMTMSDKEAAEVASEVVRIHTSLNHLWVQSLGRRG